MWFRPGNYVSKYDEYVVYLLILRLVNKEAHTRVLKRWQINTDYNFDVILFIYKSIYMYNFLSRLL